MKNRSLFAWIINHFTYTQIYIFICSLFLLSLLPIAYFWVSTHLERISLINGQLVELQEEKALENLFKQMQTHRLLTQRFLLTHPGSNIDADVDQLDQEIRLSLSKYMDLQAQESKEDQIYEPSIWQKANPRNIQSRWETLAKQIPQLGHESIEPLQTSIIQDLLIQFSYLSDKVGISYFNEIENYSLIEGVLLRLPIIQENLSQLILLSERAILNPEKGLSKERITSIINFLESDLSYLKYGINLESFQKPDFIRTSFLKSMGNFREAIESLIQIVNIHILNETPPKISFSQFLYYSEDASRTGFHLWDEGFEDLIYIFKVEKNHVINRLWIILLTTLSLASLAFALGLALSRTGTKRLAHLKEATERFANGDYSTRVPEDYQDAIGKLAQAFNRMAIKLEDIIKHLYELLNATSSLSKGDLSARIAEKKDNSEFDQVAQSFNHMAETFETIIGRLQQIGIMLTTSASEIAEASQEQETIVVEQEATTREIAVAANEISSTAKEFASTMNEMSQVAEQTSNLALTGRGSLNNMETIMSQMVDASSSIASKLGVLNEKAGNITSVITTITKVADQTNLLSLNASIEAEKAGEYGKSFAVIAREIRRLADQTAIATLDIEKMVNEIMTAVSSSVMGVDDFTQEIRNGVEQVKTVSGQLAKIIEQVQVFTARFDLLNQGMQAQSTGAEQINEAISQLSLTAQQTSEAIHQFHKTIQELNQAANELNILTPFLKSGETLDQISSSFSQEKEFPSFEPPTKESTRKFNKTLSHLSSAASKLKNFNTLNRPPFHKDKD